MAPATATHLLKMAQRRLLFKQTIIAAKDKPCADCGVQYPHYVMDFDHLTDKSFNIGRDGAKGTMERLLKEIAKCEVVCANCHRERTHNANQDYH